MFDFIIYLNFHFIYFRWLVRLFDGNGDSSKESWVPAEILDYQRTNQAVYTDIEGDAATRRE